MTTYGIIDEITQEMWGPGGWVDPEEELIFIYEKHEIALKAFLGEPCKRLCAAIYQYECDITDDG